MASRPPKPRSRTRFGRAFDRRSRRSRRTQIAVVVALVPVWLAATWHRALTISEGDESEALEAFAIVIGVYAVIIAVSFVLAAGESKDEERGDD